MRNWRLMIPVASVLFLVAAAPMLAQTTAAPAQTTPPPTQPPLAQEQTTINQADHAKGVAAEWDVKSKMAAMASDVQRIEDLLRRVRPKEWIEKGAPDAYLRQLESSQNSLLALIATTEKVAKEPEKLSAVLDALFRMENMDLLLQSLQAGVRRYQGPSLADDIVRFMSENAQHRDMLRQHSIDLAAARENELKIINTEAQRCRTELSRKNEPEVQPPPPPPVRRRKSK